MTSAHLLSGDMRLKTFRVPCEVCKKMLAFTSVSRHMKTVHAEKRENMGLCGVWKDTTGRKEIDTTSDNSQPPIRESQFFSIVKTVTTK